MHSHLPRVTTTGKPNGIVITEELRDELHAAAATTAQAYASVRSLTSGEEIVTNQDGQGIGSVAVDEILAEKLERQHRSNDDAEEGQLDPKVLVMQPILRYLQLLCENHNRDLQVCK